MLYMKCPTCKNLLGNKELVFKHKLTEIIDNEKLTQPEKDKEMGKLFDLLCLDRYCCKMRIITMTDQFSLVK